MRGHGGVDVNDVNANVNAKDVFAPGLASAADGKEDLRIWNTSGSCAAVLINWY